MNGHEKAGNEWPEVLRHRLVPEAEGSSVRTRTSAPLLELTSADLAEIRTAIESIEAVGDRS